MQHNVVVGAAWGRVSVDVVEEWELVRAALALFDRCVIWIAVLATFTLGAPPLREGRSCHAARSWLRERGAACPVGPGPVIGARAARNVLRKRKRDKPSHEPLDTDTDTASRPAFAEIRCGSLDVSWPHRLDVAPTCRLDKVVDLVVITHLVVGGGQRRVEPIPVEQQAER